MRELAVESEDLVGRIHFFEVLPQQNATGQIRAGHALAGVAEREQVMREVAVRPEAGQSAR